MSRSTHPADVRLQQRLDELMLRFQCEHNRIRRHVLWNRIKELHRQRSKREIKAMEKPMRAGP
jgi:hypothetical protein